MLLSHHVACKSLSVVSHKRIALRATPAALRSFYAEKCIGRIIGNRYIYIHYRTSLSRVLSASNNMLFVYLLMKGQFKRGVVIIIIFRDYEQRANRRYYEVLFFNTSNARREFNFYSRYCNRCRL